VTVAEVEVSAGTIEYEDTGGEGPILFFVNGLAMSGSVWRHVVADLVTDHRCVVPTFPLGAHRRPLEPHADLTLHGLRACSPSCSRPSTFATSSSSRTTGAGRSCSPPTG
jgi:pimeloyl-ACP methyl ester carboxylesterase